MIANWFGLDAHGTNVRRELAAGMTTFLTMAYILFVQPAVLSQDLAGQPTGMDPGAVLLATCLSSAGATLLMGLYGRYPIALAPGMGQNFFFVSTIMTFAAAGIAAAWQVALGVVFLSGIAFVLVSLVGIREAILNALSPSIRSSIAVGIGLFIAFIGLRSAGVIVASPGTLVQLSPQIASASWAVFWLGLLVTAVLIIRRVPGAIMLGILAALLLAAILKSRGWPVAIHWPDRLVGWPQIDQPVAFRLDILGVFQHWQICLPFIFVFLFMDLFDTLGTLIGVSEQAGLMRDGHLPRARQAMLADAAGTVLGATLGTSTVTSYIESAAGVAQGGRTGLTAVTVALLFLLALWFSPLIGLVGGYPPITAPALVMVGGMMASSVTRIDWEDTSEAIPAFLIMLGIPLCFSIADGMALGLVAYPVIKCLSGRAREVHGLMYGLSAVLLAYFLLIRADVLGIFGG